MEKAAESLRQAFAPSSAMPPEAPLPPPTSHLFLQVAEEHDALVQHHLDVVLRHALQAQAQTHTHTHTQRAGKSKIG